MRFGWLRRFRRPPTRRPIPVILWGKPGCCLCDRAEEILRRLQQEYPLQIDKRDIMTDPDASERYRLVIPVVEIVGGPRFEGKVTELWLRRALEAWTRTYPTDSG